MWPMQARNVEGAQIEWAHAICILSLFKNLTFEHKQQHAEVATIVFYDPSELVTEGVPVRREERRAKVIVGRTGTLTACASIGIGRVFAPMARPLAHDARDAPPPPPPRKPACGV